MVNFLPVANGLDTLTNGIVGRIWVVGREVKPHFHHEKRVLKKNDVLRGFVDLLCVGCTACLAFHEFSSQSSPCFHGNRLLSYCTVWEYDGVNSRLLAIRARVSHVPYLRLFSPPLREWRKRSIASCSLLATGLKFLGPAKIVPVCFFSGIPWSFSGFPEAMIASLSIRILRIALG